MQRTLILALLASSSVFAQSEPSHVSIGAISVAGATGALGRISVAPVQGAPYSATVTNESIQTLADGNRIVQTSTGAMARDSQGRTRQDIPLPSIANLSPVNAPRLVFIRDPVAQTSYTLNLTEKTATSNGTFASPAVAQGFAGGGGVQVKGAMSLAGGVRVQTRTIAIQKGTIAEEQAQIQTEDLGSKIIEGVTATGWRTTRTIPAGQVGNDKPLSIVTEVWTSPDLKLVVYSKRSDPRMGDQTFQLTDIVRAEPDPSLFTVPADFKIVDDAEPIIYTSSGEPSTEPHP